ncbi:DNA repair protein RadA [Candidatus Uhrbacteria bacterium RIFCSPHIGHO2_01_FULL_63_20]|uniref:DNA repair protein RadA n=1 Tax=Candidatus Uhrbacteria bacterium RIFCSPHIGHO2_01_FULL_63_20 TaxID=1802385 RepID=A0A1F7TLN9_9BACT|nr:MAG: DNA repair protein RadA [Candidatus Uhrbacteria bacterium RIFCSPHIGHO2_01_FULL_63_20]
MFHCAKCDAQTPKWAGRCAECGAWGTVTAEEEISSVVASKGVKAKPRASAPLSGASAAPKGRIATGVSEMDRVIGNGLVPGSLVLLSGEPGIGKSTLVAMVAGTVGTKASGGQGPQVLYVSGEESASQLASRFVRVGLDPAKINFLEPYPVETIIATIEKEKPALAVIDSVQTLSSEAVEGTPGSPALVRYATALLLEACKRTDACVLLIGQVTKDGAVAGPKTLEHLVDVVLSLEGDPSHSYRLLRATKNRFGSTDEVGVFEMAGNGLLPVENPSAKFLEERAAVPGSVVAASLEGSRVFLVEVQALVEKSGYGTPVRRASGFDGNRLQMLCAILSRRANLDLSDKDVFVNVIGGLTLSEPAADLAVCAAIVGAAKGTASEVPVLYAGEVGLGGEVRSVPHLDRRLSEAKRLGIETHVTPKTMKVVKDLF